MKHTNYSRNNNKKGFTLIEMVLVLAIITILAATATVGLAAYVKNANREAALVAAQGSTYDKIQPKVNSLLQKKDTSNRVPVSSDDSSNINATPALPSGGNNGNNGNNGGQGANPGNQNTPTPAPTATPEPTRAPEPSSGSGTNNGSDPAAGTSGDAGEANSSSAKLRFRPDNILYNVGDFFGLCETFERGQKQCWGTGGNISFKIPALSYQEAQNYSKIVVDIDITSPAFKKPTVSSVGVHANSFEMVDNNTIRVTLDTSGGNCWKLSNDDSLMIQVIGTNIKDMDIKLVEVY